MPNVIEKQNDTTLSHFIKMILFVTIPVHIYRLNGNIFRSIVVNCIHEKSPQLERNHFLERLQSGCSLYLEQLMDKTTNAIVAYAMHLRLACEGVALELRGECNVSSKPCGKFNYGGHRC